LGNLEISLELTTHLFLIIVLIKYFQFSWAISQFRNFPIPKSFFKLGIKQLPGSTF